MFKSHGLKITIEANKKIVNFLDVTFDLISGSYEPYMKPNNKLLYVHSQSNHPPALLKNNPDNINKRLTSISSSKEVFDAAITPYQKAINESGYNFKLTYNPEADQTTRNRKNRKRNKCFSQNHPLHKIFNRHTLKLSYSCMPNMKTIIASHNKNILSNVPTTTLQQPKEFNCRNKTECPLDGKCLQQNVVYQATITTDTATESYVGLATNFKERYRNHQTSFRHTIRRNETELSKHIWTLKQQLRLTQQLNPTWDWQRTSRNGTGTTRPLSVTQTEETKLNYQNTFGLSKMQRNPSKLNGKF